jgi:hypothetical protein
MAQPRNIWRIEVVEAGAMSSALFLVSATDRPLTVEQAAEARLVLDQALLRPENAEWLEGVYPWVIYDDSRIYWRSIGGLRSESRALVTRLNKNNPSLIEILVVRALVYLLGFGVK